MDNFTWVPFFEEMLNVICTKYDKASLCKVFHEIFSDAKGRNDKFSDGSEGLLREIDPLTFIAYFNRNNTSQKRINYCTHAKDIFKMTNVAPKDFDGIPSFDPMNTWFFGWEKSNKLNWKDDIWTFSKQLNNGNISNEYFYNVLQIRNVGVSKLTQAMFICKPQKYISLDSKNCAFLSSNGIDTSELSQIKKVSNGNEMYDDFLQSVNQKFQNKKFYEISYEAYHSINKPKEFKITDEQFAMLKERFDSRISGFTDFQNPGEFFEKNELGYKRKALKKYQEEVGNKQLRQWVEQGEGQKALLGISKRIQANLVQYNNWRNSIGGDDKKAAAVIKAFLDAAEKEYADSESLQPIFDVTEEQGLKASWDTFSALLWAMRPEVFAPAKISYWRSLANELGHELPKGPVTAEKYAAVLEWMKMFWDELEKRDYKPNDWVDVHSFIWCVCPDTYSGKKPDSLTYWVIAPGENASQWEDFKEKGIIAINGSELGDLNNYQNKETIEQTLQKELRIDTRKTNDALAYYEFANKMQIGDYVFVKKGVKKLLGYGRITSGYTYDSQREWGQHIRNVEWLKTGEWELPENTSFTVKALTDITNYPDFVSTLLQLVEKKDTPKGSESKSYWWLNANPKVWNFEEIPIGGTVIYTSYNDKGNKRRIYKYFEQAKPGDIVIGYLASPNCEVAAVCEIKQGLHNSPEGMGIELAKVEQLENPVSLKQLKSIEGLNNCEPLINNQGSLFKLMADEYEIIRDLIDELNPDPKGEDLPELFTKTDALSYLFISEDEFDNILSALKYKKNVLLQGPPGVGKTFIARYLAYTLMGQKDDQKIQMIQFHQSYSYEDFIQGYRPNDEGKFDLKNGVFYEFCKKAQRDKDNKYVFIIDEINRGNLSKIFGELMMLIEVEKRGTEYAVPLTYAKLSEDKFHIPPNLYLIGTMNTADRSLAIVDYALRRRFRFVELWPQFSSQKFKKFLLDRGVEKSLLEVIIDKLGNLNKKISEDQKDLGPGYQIGHSFFCPNDEQISYDRQWYELVIRHEVEPLLKEYWFDDSSKVKDLVDELLG